MATIQAYHPLENSPHLQGFLGAISRKWLEIAGDKKQFRVFRERLQISLISDSRLGFLSGNGEGRMRLPDAESAASAMKREIIDYGLDQQVQPVTFTAANLVGKSKRAVGNEVSNQRIAIFANPTDNGADVLLREADIVGGTMWRKGGGKAGSFAYDYYPHVSVGWVGASEVAAGRFDEYMDVVREILPVELAIGSVAINVVRT
jgi:hypothetical protein